ncbi:MAG: hypothetical protein KAJ19_09265, partial [Gammaproteobacteria bacterium]|nr:hypothetical protein [Gammaproteobacteria bacterium]
DAYRYGYYFGCLDGYGGYGVGSDGMRTSNEVMFTDNKVMVIHPSYEYYYDYYYGYEEYGRRGGDDDQRTNQTLYMVDLSDPGSPVLLPQYIFPTYTIYNMMCMGNTIYFTEMEYVGSYDDGNYYAPQKIRYQLGRVDLSDLEEPVRKGGVNIPGTLLGISADGEVIYTLSRWYLEDAEGYVYIQTINALEISDGFAYLRSAVVEEDAIRGLVVEDRAIYYCTGPQYYYYYYWYGDGWDAVDAGNISTTFHVLDFSDPAEPVRVSSTVTSGYASLITVQEGHAFFRVDYGGGVMIYDLDDPEEPELLGLYLTQSYSSMRIYSQRVLLVQGVYGVMTVHFGTGAYD